MQCEKIFDEGIKINFHCTKPLCFFPEAFIERLKNMESISNLCHLHNRSGVVFDTNLNLLPCNAMFKFPFAIYGKDFDDGDTLLKFWNSPKITEMLFL